MARTARSGGMGQSGEAAAKMETPLTPDSTSSQPRGVFRQSGASSSGASSSCAAGGRQAGPGAQSVSFPSPRTAPAPRGRVPSGPDA